jgi:hypothetical protein
VGEAAGDLGNIDVISKKEVRMAIAWPWFRLFRKPSSPWIKSTAAGSGGCRPGKPTAFRAVDHVALKFTPHRG